MAVKLHAFLIVALRGFEFLVSFPDDLFLGEDSRCLFNLRPGEFQASLNGAERKKLPLPRVRPTLYLKNKRPAWCHLLFYFTSYVLNMFRTLICPSSGACDYSVKSPRWSYCSWFDVCWRFGVVGLEWYPCCRLKQNISMSETCRAHKKWNKQVTSSWSFILQLSQWCMVQ